MPQENMIDLSLNIESTTAPMTGRDIPNGLAECKTTSLLHSTRIEMSCHSSPLLRTDSQNMRVQTHESKDLSKSCTTALKNEIKNNKRYTDFYPA